MAMYKNSNAIHTPQGHTLGAHLDPNTRQSVFERIDLANTREECKTLMEEIRKTAKEVGGDPRKSNRFAEAEAIIYHIDQLERLGTGHYTYNIADGDKS